MEAVLVKRSMALKWSLVALCLFVIYRDTLGWCIQRWQAPGSYYSHGFLIPFVVGFLVWRKLKKLGEITPRPSWTGLFLLLTGLIVHLLSAILRVYFPSGFSLLLVLFGLVLFLLGRETTRELSFPLAFLVFMLPLPSVLVDTLAFKTKLLASEVAVRFLQFSGLSVVREGSFVQTPHSILLVGDPCSGLRSLISLLALGALVVYLMKTSRAKKLFILMSTIPVALFCNWIRVVALILVSEIYGSEVAGGFFHDASGIFLFLLALGCFFAIRRGVDRLWISASGFSF